MTLQDGSRHRARFLITAIGPLSAPTMPRIEGVDTFKGQSFHTAQWPHEPVSFAGKRVAVIGTGATGVQTIAEVAKTAGHLTVFQRTPNWCKPLHNGTDRRRRRRPGSRPTIPRCSSAARRRFACFIHTTDPRGTFEVTPEEREAFLEKQYATPGFGMWQGNFRDMLTNREANALISDFVARKIRERVKDPKVAEKLIPKDHGFGTRRVPMETSYYEVYNQPNVELVDIKETPIERITPKGIKTSDARVRVRHHHLRHRLRRHHRQLRSHRHPRPRRAAAQGQVEGRPADVPRRAGRRLPQHVDAGGAAHRARQHSPQHRVQRRMGDAA